MDVFSRYQRTHQWTDRTGEDFCIRLFCHFADGAGVDLCTRQRAVASNRCDAKNIEFRACECQKNGDCIVLTWIGIDNDFTGHEGFLR